MPRGRPPKKKTEEQNTQNNADQTPDYYNQFSRAFLSAMNNPNIYANPFLQNEILKNVNMNPKKYDRDEVEKLIANPRANEDAIRDLANFLEGYIMHFKRLVFLYGGILTFDHYLEPTNADEDDMKSTAFKKSEKKAYDWLDRFSVKKTFTDVMRMVILEEAIYYYVRESESGISLQQMPSKWSKIIRKTDFGYQYAFNMMYFLQSGVNLEDYPSEFTDYFNEYTSTEDYKKGYPYWKELDPLQAPVFKFDENRAGVIPPLMGLFIDSTEIATYKQLLKTKTELEVWKIILSKIPMHNDGKGTQAKNNFAIDADTAAKFNAIIQSAIPTGTKSIVTPFETEAIDFSQSENKNNIAGIGEDMFYNAAGTSPILFGQKNSTGVGVNLSVKTDEAFVKHIYFEFERFVNAHLKKTTGRFRFKIHFEGTIFDQEERFERALKAAMSGAPKTYLAIAMGKSVSEFVNLSNYENSIGLIEKMKPLVSAHTQSSDGGRPQSTDNQLSASGEKTKDTGANENR